MICKYLTKFIDEYNDVYNEVWKSQNFKHPLGEYVRKDIANKFRELSILNPDCHVVKASCGAGKWTAVPWIAIFDNRITKSAQKGVYIVYLLNKDSKELYLTLNQGASGSTLSELENNAKSIQNQLGIERFEKITTGSDAYDAGCILSKKYTLEDLKRKEIFLEDLKFFLQKYQQYQTIISQSIPLKLQKISDTKTLSFEEWITNHSERKYRDSTIKRYIIALQKVEERLSIVLEKPLLEIRSLFEFESAVKKIQTSPNYDFINKKYGNGDLSAALSAYAKYLKDVYSVDDSWWPSLEEYTPGFTKEKWLEILNNPEIVGPVWGSVLAMFHTEPDGATCKMLAEKFNDSPQSISGKCSQLADKIHSETKCPLFVDERGKFSYWSILFQGREVKGDESGSWVWRLRKELYDALTEFGIEKYLPQEVEEGEKMTTKEKVSAIKSYIASKGFNYEGSLIENFYLSLKSKPFVILAGTSGTGKTRLVKLFAEAINAKMLLVPVRPDWSDSSDLFGHVDLSGKFNPGAILEFIKEAQDNTYKPYFLCLDEMNLARVEYYFSDFLSIIETRENVDGKIVSDSLVDEKYYKKDTAAAEKYGKIIIPENLYIIGTVNMDETTFPFSKKVLDRANTIEFSFVDLMAKPVVNTVAMPRPLNEDNAFLKTEYLYLNDVTDDNTVTTTCFELEQLNQILLKANLHVGYRVRDEITFYMTNNKNADNLISETAAFDNQIMQKILPRIQGSSSAIKEVLIEVFQKCAGDYSGLTGSNTYEQMINCIETKECKYPNSARKIAFMVRRFEEDGFTSYWL